MADRVLPSRDDLRSILDSYEGWRGDPQVRTEWQVLDAYVSGRLVDREAIDYEAASKEAGCWTGVVFDLPKVNHAARAIVDAALGVTDG